MRRLLGVLFVLVTCAVAVLAFVMRRDYRQPNLQVLPADMVRSPAAKSGTTTTAFPDGLVQRTPPEGTVGRGARPLEYGPSLEEAKRAGEELTSPIPPTPEALARGELVFTTWCACCHGASGLGDAPVTKRGFPPPPSLLRPESKALKDGEIFHALSFGRKNMPSPATNVERADRWKVIQFVRRLQEAPK